MNKRIRKKQLKRALCGLLAAYDEYEAARERVFRKALQDVVDTFGMPKEEFAAAFRYLDVGFLLLSSGPPPRFLEEYKRSSEPQPHS